MSKLMTERQAWLYLAERIEISRLLGSRSVVIYGDHDVYALWLAVGLCGCIRKLQVGYEWHNLPGISEATRLNMHGKIDAKKVADKSHGLYLWPIGDLLSREAFCRAQAA